MLFDSGEPNLLIYIITLLRITRIMLNKHLVSTLSHDGRMAARMRPREKRKPDVAPLLPMLAHRLAPMSGA